MPTPRKGETRFEMNARRRGEIFPVQSKARLELDIRDGMVLVGSDAHFWPGQPPTTAWRAFRDFAQGQDVLAVILNGDVMDGARVGRHPSIGWEKRPNLVGELTEAQERLAELIEASPQAHHIWTLGNHDMRFETRLAMVAPEYAHIKGMHLKDHFPAWTPAWSCWINGQVVVKHRWKGGDHAAFNNVVRSGMSVVTGHLHNLQIAAYSDYNGTRFGVDSGCLAEPYGPQFLDYTEDNPVNWRSGFVVLTFRNGRLMWPEPLWVVEPGVVCFRGEMINV